MEQINYSSQFIDYLDDLVFVLYSEEYFGFIDTAFEYIDRVYDFIELNIKRKSKKVNSDVLKMKGEFILSYPVNSRTTWYILFDKNQEEYQMNFIFNNHEKYAQYIDL